jgi:oligopeptide/dipeptide ABC transporter ATP-binding protein
MTERAAHHVGEVLELVGLRRDSATLYPHEFSGGQREGEAVYAEPLHPYTQALLSAALPLHPSARRQRIVLAGEVPNPTNPPAGCRFHPHCPRAMPQCGTTEPEWQEIKRGRFAACHLY